MKTILPLFLLIIYHSSFSQQVIQNVSFDNYISVSDNDFANNFSGSTALYQIPANGISGGCLAAPDSNNWGNDNAFYCSRYAAQAGGLYITSIAFKYDSTLVVPGTGDRAVSIWMHPYSDFNHYLIASVTQQKTIQLLSYSWVNLSPPQLTLNSGNWYRLTLQATMTGGVSGALISVGAAVHDLGPAGTSVPSLAGNVTGSFEDSVLFNDTSIAVSITGSGRGGAAYLDNFHFEGIKGMDNCIPTTIEENENIQQTIIYQQSNLLTITSAIKGKLHLYNSSGSLVITGMLNEGTSTFSTEHLESGIYNVMITGKGPVECRKIMIFQ